MSFKELNRRFWLGQGASIPIHLAFNAQTRKQVDVFCKEGIKAGVKDNDQPGIREKYYKNY